jgi:serine protease
MKRPTLRSTSPDAAATAAIRRPVARSPALRRAAALLLAAGVLAACGGGSEAPTAVSPSPDARPPAAAPAAATYVVSGTMAVTETSAVDSDSNDPNQPARADNGSFDTLQPLPNPVHLVGYLTMPGQGPDGPLRAGGDIVDGYRVFLEQGQVVEVAFAADPRLIDIDLFVYDNNRVLRGLSIGLNTYECVSISTSGEYFVAVQLFEGTSSGGSLYQMRVGAAGSGTNCAVAAGGADLLVPGEIVAQPAEPALKRAASGAGTLADVAVLKGDPGADRPVLVQVPVGRAAEDAARRLKAAAQVRSRAPGAPGAAATAPPPAVPAAAGRAMAAMDAWRRQLPRRSLDIHRTVDHAKLMVASGEYRGAVPNFMVHAAQTVTMGPFPPNDRDYVKQRWHYDAINLTEAVDALQGIDLSASPAPIVAVVDTGIVADHPDLTSQLVAGFDFVSESDSAGDGGGSDANPDDASLEQGAPFHGSHVAGTVAGQTYNGIGGAGVAPVARVMPVRVLGTGGAGSLYDILQGIRFAAGLATDAGVTPPRVADVINLSLGAAGIACEPMLQALFDEVRARGVVVVAAAGNESRPGSPRPLGFPANCSQVFAVPAITRGGERLFERAFYSNVGPENLVAGPGGDLSRSNTATGLPDGIYSTTASVGANGSRQATYGYLQGTSMAAPHVAGVIALMRWVSPGLTPRAIEDLIRSGAIVDDLGDPGRDTAFGYGLIDARKAVDAALAARGGGPAPTPPGETVVQPSSIGLGSLRNEAELVVSRIGSTDERVLSVTSDSPFVSVAPRDPGSVDAATGLGTYRVRAEREAMAIGSSAFPNILVQLSTARTLTVQVAIERRPAAAGNGSTGPTYVLVLDAADPARPTVATTTVAAAVNGRYGYAVTVPGTAAISIIAGSDLDNDGAICSSGEACGAYPMLSSQLEVLRPEGDLTGLDFTLVPYGGISPDALGMPRR